MRIKTTSLIVVFLLFFPFSLYAWEGKVVGVTDGDTIKVLKDGKQVKIRLASIYCPEKVGLWKEPNKIAPWEWRKNKWKKSD